MELVAAKARYGGDNGVYGQTRHVCGVFLQIFVVFPSLGCNGLKWTEERLMLQL